MASRRDYAAWLLPYAETRQRLLTPKLEAFKGSLDDLHPKVLGNSGLARAIEYTESRWRASARVADDGHYPIGQQPFRKRDPSNHLGPRELAVRRIGDGGRACCGDYEPDRDQATRHRKV